MPSLFENGSGEEYLKSSQCIFTIFKLSPLWEGCGPSFEQNWFPFTQECFVPSFVEVGSGVLEKKILQSFQRIFTISQLSPLWEGLDPSFEQTWIPFTQGYFVPGLVEIGQMVREKKMKMWKVCRQTDEQTDRRQVIRKAHLSFQLRWAQNYK